MDTTVSPVIGVIGDFRANDATHQFTNAAAVHLGAALEWVPTDRVGRDAADSLGRFDGLWIASGSPYRSMEGALGAIRFARERGVPLVGT
jgi:CTP synthase (UTP-ammonia lyase)